MNIENHNAINQYENLISIFQELSPAIKQAYPDFNHLPFEVQTSILKDISENLNNAYLIKMSGQKMRHCSSETKRFCINWFISENNLKTKEDALNSFEERLAVEEELTYIFETFDINLQKKHIAFYELQYDQKLDLLKKMQEEKKEKEEKTIKLEIKRNITTSKLNAGKNELTEEKINLYKKQIIESSEISELNETEKTINKEIFIFREKQEKEKIQKYENQLNKEAEESIQKTEKLSEIQEMNKNENLMEEILEGKAENSYPTNQVMNKKSLLEKIQRSRLERRKIIINSSLQILKRRIQIKDGFDPKTIIEKKLCERKEKHV